MSQNLDVSFQLATLVCQRLHAEASTKTVANRIGLSERTFARRLAAEGLSFGEILDHLRYDLAVRYLDEDMQTSQIAWLLGFHQPSSFSHACRRWTGKSPSEFRRQTRQRVDLSIATEQPEAHLGITD